MPYAAPYQQKYPPTQRTKNKPMGAWGALFDNGQPAEKLYGGNQKFGQPNTGMFGANPALAGRLWQSPMQQVPRTLGVSMASPGSMGGRYTPASAGGYGGPNSFFDGPGPTAGFAAPVGMNRPGYGQPGMPESPAARYPFSDQEVGPMLGRVPIGPGMQVPEGGAPGDAEALKAAYMRRRDQQFLNPSNPNQERMAQLTGVPLSESIAYARANMQPVARGTVPSVGSANPSVASINNINAQMLTDPTNIQAQFSSQLGQPSADESALAAWEAMRNASPVTRESLLAQANNGGRLTSGLTSGIDDPSYNRDGRFFGGAVPTQDANGRVSYTTREQADPGAAEREARRLQHMEQLKARQGGDRPPQPYLQRGTAALSSPSDLPQFANKDLQAQRRATQAERMARVTERAAAMAEQRKESLAARRRGPSVMDMLMQRNPALAVQMQEVQQRGQIAQAQMQNQMAMQKEANAGNLAVANAQGANQLNGINAQIGGNKEVAQIQAGVQKELAGLQREVENRKITVDEARAKAEALNAGAGLLAGLAAAGVQSGQQIPPETMNSLASILGLVGPRTSAVAGAPGAGAPPATQGPFGPAQGGQPQPSRDVNAKIYAGGKLNDADLGVIKDAFTQSADKAFQIAMNQYGLSRQEAVDLINSDLIGNSWMWERTPEAPGYWESLLWSPGTRGPGGYEGWSKRP